MNAEPMHEELRDLLAAEAVDALDGEERERLLAHLAGCAACRAELDDLRESAALVALAAPARPMDADRSARVRARLLARAAADRPAPEPAESKVIPITAARRRPVLPWLAAAASVALLIGVGAYALALRGRLDRLGERYAALEQERGALVRAVEEREATLAALSAPAARVIDLAAARPAAPSGRMFWDPSTDRWTFFAHNLPQVPSGREYQLWLVTPGRKISAGTFRPDGRGSAVVQATYVLAADSLQAVAVTEEPAGGVPQPTGAIIIAGAAAE